jgi:hypothetical protein
VSAAHLAVVSLAFAAALGAAACGGSDKRALFPSGCTNPTYKPRQIIVTCADAHTVPPRHDVHRSPSPLGRLLDPGGLPMSRSVIPKALVAAALATAALFALAAIPAGGATKVLFPPNCGTPSYRPTTIVVTCGDANNRVTGIVWQSYGTSTASGKGTARVNDCKPNCASGKVKSYPAVVALSKPKKCSKRVTQFTHLVETFTKSRPSGLGKSLSETFRCSR